MIWDANLCTFIFISHTETTNLGKIRVMFACKRSNFNIKIFHTNDSKIMKTKLKVQMLGSRLNTF